MERMEVTTIEQQTAASSGAEYERGDLVAARDEPGLAGRGLLALSPELLDKLDQERIDDFRERHSADVGGMDVIELNIGVPCGGVDDAAQCVYLRRMVAPRGSIELIAAEADAIANRFSPKYATAVEQRAAQVAGEHAPADDADVADDGFDGRIEDELRLLRAIARTMRLDVLFMFRLSAAKLLRKLGERAIRPRYVEAVKRAGWLDANPFAEELIREAGADVFDSEENEVAPERANARGAETTTAA